MKISNLKSQISNLQKGQSLFEVVVAIAISALIIVAVVSLATSSIRNATFSRNKNQAAVLAQGATEWLRTERDSDIANFLTYSQTPKWCMNSLSFSPTNIGSCSGAVITGTPFTREISFTNKTPLGGKTLIQADVNVSWTDTQGLHEVTVSTDFTDWRQR